jgi:hypothetical protein
MDDAWFPVIATGKFKDCVSRAQTAIEASKPIVVLGKGRTIYTAISISEYLKRAHPSLTQTTRIYTKQFGDKALPCIEIKLSGNLLI